MRDPRHRSFCFQDLLSSSNLCFLKTRPIQEKEDVFQMPCSHIKRYSLPPFSLIGMVLTKVSIDQASLVVITPEWQTKSWYSHLLTLSIRNQLLSPQTPNFLKGPTKELHLLVENRGMQLLAWIILSKNYLRKEYQKNL